MPANVVGYDHETGSACCAAIAPLKLKPLARQVRRGPGERDPVVIASFGGLDMAAPACVVAKREFAGGWEYLLDGRCSRRRRIRPGAAPR